MEKKLFVQSGIYPLEVVLATSHLFLDRCYIHLSKDKGGILVRLKPKGELSENQFAELVGEYENELLNQTFRRKLSMRTGHLRDAIVQRALFSALPESAALELEAEDDLDFLDDPLGIAIPWEEKYGKKGNKESE